MKSCKGLQERLDLSEILSELSTKILENDVILSSLLLSLSKHYSWTSQH